MLRLTGIVALAALLALPALAPAQGIVIANYAAPVMVAPPPVVTTAFYAPVVTAFPAPVVTAYAAPAVTFYRSPAFVTYRQPLLRPRTTIVRVAPVVVFP
jgi:hypothetical protein